MKARIVSIEEPVFVNNFTLVASFIGVDTRRVSNNSCDYSETTLIFQNFVLR